MTACLMAGVSCCKRLPQFPHDHQIGVDVVQCLHGRRRLGEPARILRLRDAGGAGEQKAPKHKQRDDTEDTPADRARQKRVPPLASRQCLREAGYGLVQLLQIGTVGDRLHVHTKVSLK